VKILLVNPPPYRIQEAFYDRPPYPRISLAFLAASLRSNGMDVSVLDCKFDCISHEMAVNKIYGLKPDLVGYTAFTNEVIQAGLLADDVKRSLPASRAIIGGVHVTILPEKTLREFPAFDYACVGEGENKIVELVKFLECNGITAKPESIKGIAFLDNSGNYIWNGEREKIGIADKSLETIPFPAWDMFRPASYYILHTQRGCPYHCLFCVNPNGRVVRKESPERVINQVKELYERYNCRTILFGDEIFTIDRERTIAICNGLIKQRLNKKLKWRCQTHVNFIDEELAAAMKNAGCSLIGLGIESGDPERLKKIGKGTSLEKILSVVSGLKRVRLPFEAFFILGQPDETEESARQTIDFAIKLNPATPVFGIMVPYPGTKICKMAEAGEGGYILSALNWNDYNKQIGDALEFSGVQRKTLERIQFLGYIKVFLFNLRLLDFIKFCWKYKREGITVVKKSFLNVARKRK
jgi:radical SAM superfamily enzyme YgiQ (UPF0313 family)